MMQDEYTARMIFDQDTMLDRINHQLNRLFQMLQSGKRTIEEQRMDLQGMIVLEKQQAAIYETLATALGSIFLKAEEKRLQALSLLAFRFIVQKQNIRTHRLGLGQMDLLLWGTLSYADEQSKNNNDNSINEKYCIYCFKDGAFVDDCTMDDMIEISVQHMSESGMLYEQNKGENEAREFMYSFFRI